MHHLIKDDDPHLRWLQTRGVDLTERKAWLPVISPYAQLFYVTRQTTVRMGRKTDSPSAGAPRKPE